MKKECIILFTLGTLSGCIGSVESPYVDKKPDLDDFITCSEYEIPVKEGYMSYTKFGDDTIAVTNVPLAIVVPKTASATRANYQGIETTYQLYDPSIGFYSSISGWQTVCLEDTKNGDHDYNDLVIHPKYQIEGNGNNKKLKIGIHPIAYGASRDMKLGFRCRENKGRIVADEVISENVRGDLFENLSGFINTERYDKHFPTFTLIKEYPITTNSAAALYVDWYIISNGDTIYAFNQSKKDDFTEVDKNGYPFGIVFINTGQSFKEGARTVGANWFAYPLEKNSLESCYTFGDWKFDSALDKSRVFDLEEANKEDGKRIFEVNNANL